MLCALFALLYFLACRINATLLFDPQHGCNHDVGGAVQSQSLRSLLLLIMISMNVMHGPDESYHRYGQMMDIVLAHMDASGPTLCAVFQFLLSKLMTEFDISVEPGEFPEMSLWQAMMSAISAMNKKLQD